MKIWSHVSDFGIAKFIGDGENAAHTKTLVTLRYMAPGNTFTFKITFFPLIYVHNFNLSFSTDLFSLTTMLILSMNFQY